MDVLIGRQKEQKTLWEHYHSKSSEFVAIYGRRRVGKTFLVRQVFQDKFAFHLTGMAGVSLAQQLGNYHAQISKYAGGRFDHEPAFDWFTAFQQLIKWLEHLPKGEKKVVFIDELPWLDTRNSRFLSGLEHFWNSWASARRDVILIVCGSAASWMINNLINSRGGLHNRVTHRIVLDPFTLAECEAFLQQKSAPFNRYQIIQLYMALGGIPFYLDLVEPGKSVAQNINDLCFTPRSMLRREFENLYASLFKNAGRHVAVIETLAKSAKGVERSELLKMLKMSDGGTITKTLRELEESGFIKKYPAFGKGNRYVLYQLSDFYSFFYLRFIKDSSDLDKDFWLKAIDNPEIRAWSGYAFEQVCLAHLEQIKHALGISGVQTRSSAWVGESGGQKAQIDLVIDRRDQVINLCEMKFSLNKFQIDKRYADELRSKIAVFKSATQTKKAIFLTLITTFGLDQGEHGGGLIQNSLTMDVLF